MNWKEQFDRKWGAGEDKDEVRVGKEIKSFISTEIIEKLIAEASSYFIDDYGMAKELRKKWL
jgi:hypothetical protein